MSHDWSGSNDWASSFGKSNSNSHGKVNAAQDWNSSSNGQSNSFGDAAAETGASMLEGIAGDQESLVAQVKALQKQNPSAKEQWIAFTAKKGGNTRDPTRHTAEFLQEYLTTVNVLAPVGSTPMGGSPTDEGLATQIKEMQRYDQNAKEQWAAFTDMKGGGKKDPNRHSAELLQEFLVGLSSGTNFLVQSAEIPGDLCEVIKSMQKKSQAFREMWKQFASTQGGGRFDPSKHDNAFHFAFFEAIAALAMSSGGEPDASALGLPEVGPGDNPAKRARTDSGGDQKQQLVNQIKAFQKSGAEQKELWGAYADTYLRGVKDPSRQEAAVLQEFCENHDVPELPAGGFGSLTTGGGGGGFGSLTTGGGGGFGSLPTGGGGGFGSLTAGGGGGFGSLTTGGGGGFGSLTTGGGGFGSVFGGGGAFGGGGGAFGGGGACGTSAGIFGAGAGGGGGGAAGSANSEVADLANRVKAFCKAMPDNRELWLQFCGATKDPARHTEAKLTEFCTSFDI